MLAQVIQWTGYCFLSSFTCWVQKDYGMFDSCLNELVLSKAYKVEKSIRKLIWFLDILESADVIINNL